MTIRKRLMFWLGGILLLSLIMLSLVTRYEFDEQQDLHTRNMTPDPTWLEVGEVVLSYGLFTMVTLLLGSWVLLHKVLAPVTSLTRAAENIDVHNLKERLPRTGNGDELDRLSAVLNSMIERLEKSFDQVRDFTLNASHELKTPLTLMRAELETALRDIAIPQGLRDVLVSQIAEIDRLARVVDSLTLLAKADAGHLVLSKVPVQMDELVCDIAEDAQALAEPHGIKIELSPCESVVISADRHRLKQLLLNILDNAIKYNHPNGFVQIALRSAPEGIKLAISNSGPGITLDKIPRVFDRFFRGDLSHSGPDGCGLGLALARCIVRAHGGEITFDSQPGKLTTVSVFLPASHAGSCVMCFHDSVVGHSQMPARFGS